MYQTNVVVSSLALYLVTGRRPFLVLACFSLTASVTGKCLKTICRTALRAYPEVWQRPDGAINCSGYYNESTNVSQTGMPSGHSLGAFAFATLATLYVLRKDETDRENAPASWAYVTWSKIVLLYVAATAVALSRTTVFGPYSAGGVRVPVACHTPAQVAVGATCGVVVAWVFFRYFGDYLFDAHVEALEDNNDTQDTQDKRVRFAV